jgi:hypothetical protein
MLSSGI